MVVAPAMRGERAPANEMEKLNWRRSRRRRRDATCQQGRRKVVSCSRVSARAGGWVCVCDAMRVYSVRKYLPLCKIFLCKFRYFIVYETVEFYVFLTAEWWGTKGGWFKEPNSQQWEPGQCGMGTSAPKRIIEKAAAEKYIWRLSARGAGGGLLLVCVQYTYVQKAPRQRTKLNGMINNRYIKRGLGWLEVASPCKCANGKWWHRLAHFKFCEIRGAIHTIYFCLVLVSYKLSMGSGSFGVAVLFVHCSFAHGERVKGDDAPI